VEGKILCHPGGKGNSFCKRFEFRKNTTRNYKRITASLNHIQRERGGQTMFTFLIFSKKSKRT